jgi:pimeloyl-ACP methyl ester carboxylesterase
MVYGHSMGGSIAVMLAATRPDLVSRLLLSEANLDPGGGFLSRSVAEQSEEQFVASGHRAVLDKFKDWPTRIATLRDTDSIGFQRSAVSLVAGTKPTWRDRFYAMKLPKAWIVGDQSEPEEDIAKMKPQGIPVFVIANAGHDMAIQNPAALAAAIARGLTVT